MRFAPWWLNLDVLRPGSFLRAPINQADRNRDQPAHPHHLSHGDCVRVFEQAITYPGVKFEVVFGVSDSDWPLYDMDHGRQAIGYHPQDRSHVPEEERE